MHEEVRQISAEDKIVFERSIARNLVTLSLWRAVNASKFVPRRFANAPRARHFRS